ncbi:MAG: O-antigen ligase family protein [Clostridiales bacterium]|nr:O-antigen ligase family protein [Clostridiales bacterium]
MKLKNNQHMATLKENMVSSVQHNWYTWLYICLLTITLFFRISPLHEPKVNIIYILPMACSAFVLALYINRQHLLRGQKVLILLMIWLAFSCVLNGDIYLQQNRTFLLTMFISMVMGYSVVGLCSSNNRNKAFHAVSIAYIILIAILSVLSIYSALGDQPIFTPFSNQPIYINPADARLAVFGYHSNEVGCFTLIASYLCIYFFFKTNKLWIKLCNGILALMFIIVIMLTGSRTALLLYVIGIGCAFIVMILNRMNPKDQKAIIKKTIIAVLIACVVVAMIAALYTPAVNLFASLTNKIAQNDDVAIGEANAVTIPRARSFQLKDFLSMGARTPIWKAAFEYLQSNPKTLLIGVPENVVSTIAYEAIYHTAPHMHNSMIQILLLAGIPGLCMILFFLFIVLRASVRLFFASRAAKHLRFLAFIPVLLLLNNFTEIFPMLSGDIMDMMFFVICAAVVGFEHDLKANQP